MNNNLKVSLSVVLLSLSASILVSHTTGNLYPVVSIALIVPSVFVLIVHARSDMSPIYTSLIFAFIGAAHRAWIFIFPSSLMRFDPDAYAVQSQVILQQASLEALIDGFYQIASIFTISGAVSSLMTNLPIDNAYVIFPLVIGITLPLFASVLSRRLKFNETGGVFAAAIVAVGAPSTRFSTAPIPLTLAALFMCGCVICIVLITCSARTRYIFCFSIFLIASGATHKIPIFLLSCILILFIIYTKCCEYVSHSNFLNKSEYYLALLVVSSLVLQWSYITQYLESATFSIIEVLRITNSQPPLPEPAAATQVSRPLIISLINNSYFIFLVAFGGAAGVYFFKEYYRRRTRLVQASALVTVCVTLPSAFLSVGPGFQRIYVYASPFVAALIGGATSEKVFSSFSQRNIITTIAILCLLISNPLSAAATPDQPNFPRQYLTPEEVEGKHWSNDHISNVVYRDLFYGDEVVDFKRAARGDEWYQNQVPNPWDPGLLSRELYQGTLVEQNYDTISIRTQVKYFRLRGGSYQLRWNPEAELNVKYNRVYANGGVVTYDKPEV